MKTRLIISDRTWKYRLHAAPQEPGKYFVTLRGEDGATLKPGAATGPFRTLDAIVEDAPRLYRQLVAMRESACAAGAMNATCHETSLNHSAEFTARA